MNKSRESTKLPALIRWLLWAGVAGALVAAVLLLPSGPSLTPMGNKPVAVEVTIVDRGPVSEYIATAGLAQANRKAFLQFEREGRVGGLGKNSDGSLLAVGSRVQQGQILAMLEPRETSAQAAQALATLQETQQNLNRVSQLASEGLATEAQREAAAADHARAEASLRESQFANARDVLRAPFDGVITALNIKPGDTSLPQPAGSTSTEREAASAIVLAGEGAIDIEIQIAPAIAGSLKPGGRAYVGLQGTEIELAIDNAGPNAALAQIVALGSSVSLRSRSIPATLRVEDPPEFLMDGLLVQAFVEKRQVENAMRVPQRALIPRGERTFVCVVDPDSSTASLREVRVGALGIADAEITAGLSSGEQVVVSGQHLLSDGTAVRIAVSASEAADGRVAP